MIQSAIDIEATCQVNEVGHQSITVGCAATVTNASSDTVLLTATAVSPTSVGLGAQTYVLLPGQSTQLPTPPAGAVWLVEWETTAQAASTADWLTAGAIAVGALAGVGLVDLFVAVSHALWKRRL